MYTGNIYRHHHQKALYTANTLAPEIINQRSTTHDEYRNAAEVEGE